jgi:hypothetical protein
VGSRELRRSSAAVDVCCSRSFSGCVADGGDEERGVVVVESGDGVAEVDGDAACEAG